MANGEDRVPDAVHDGPRLDGQVALVTGAAQGMGREIARVLGARGARIGLLDIKADALATVARDLGPEVPDVSFAAADITDADEVESAVSAIASELEGLTILVHCAGIAAGNAPTWELGLETWDRAIAVNLSGAFRVARAVVPRMLDGGYGRIVFIASIAGKEGNPNASHYSASKAGLIGLTKSLGKELATSDVLVNAIAPAVIDTPMIRDSTPEQLEYMVARIPMGRIGRVDEVAQLAAFLASPRLTYSTGAVYDLSGGRATY